MSIDPASVTVLAVGIERYASTLLGDIPGAATAATRFARWALSCGVPADRVTLACNWLDTTDADAPEHVRCLEPSCESLRNEIAGLTGDEGSLLLVYWCGHGVLDERRERILFTSDTKDEDKRNIRLDDVLFFLASRKLTGLGRQLLLVDACANFAADFGSFDDGLPRDAFPSAPGREIEQFALFAAGQGRAAQQRRARRDTVFSDAALGWLEEHAHDLPPNTDRLWSAVQRRFTEHDRQMPVYWRVDTASGVKEEGGVVPVSGTVHAAARGSRLTVVQLHRLAKRIVSLSSRLGDEGRDRLMDALFGSSGVADPDEWQLAEHARSLCARGELPELLQAVRVVGMAEPEQMALLDLEVAWRRQQRIAPVLRSLGRLTPQQVREAYFRAVPPDAAEVPEDIDAALDLAAEYGLGDGVPLLRLVARLEHLTGRRIDDEWYGVGSDRLEALRSEGRRDPSELARLVIDLANPDLGGSQWPASVDGHLRLPGGEWRKSTVTCQPTREGMRAAINEHLQGAYERGLAIFRVGLIVSRATLDERPESWEYAEHYEPLTPLWCEYPTVLHCAERLKIAKLRNKCRDKATAILTGLVDAPPDVAWLGSGHRDDPDSIRRAVIDNSLTCFGLAFAPGQYCGNHLRDPLMVMFVSGAPFVLWTDEEQGDWQVFKDEIADLVRRERFEDLPLRIHAARGKNAPILANVRLIWDEPDGLPTFAALPGPPNAGSADA